MTDILALRTETTDRLTILTAPPLQLPWTHDILAIAQTPNGERFAITQRIEQPSFIVHHVNRKGACYHGDYFNTFAEAFARFVERVGYKS